ncbi:MAG TPA: hypothetical protein VM327_04500 [Candidatus Thermoplasmatota archaeon]|nr:hypothetical protein [Candidatus Thermoplasmatota archaeon]
MLRRLLLASALLGALFSGCLDSGQGADPVDDAVTVAAAGPLYKGTGRLFAGPALYKDPQNTPHPSFNFPTLANPAVGPGVPESWKPIPPAALPEHITALTHVVQTEGVTSGAGIAVFGSLVVVPGFGADTSVVDISDPTQPKLLSQFKPQEGLSTHRGAAFIPYPTGQLVVVISTGAGIDVWDLTDPVAPQPLPFLLMNRTDGSTIGSHKVGVIPGTPIVVNAASDGGARSAPESSTGVTQMWDLSDPQNPFRLPDFQNGYSCHHVYFWNSLDEGKSRGVCAGVQYTQIWDTADPYHPSVVVSVPFGTGGTPADAAGAVQFSAGLSHYAGLSLDGKVLIMGDESGGGSAPPGCTARVDTPMGGVSPPVGAVWFYDVTDEQNPRLLSWISASQLEKMGMQDDPAGEAPRSCTAHHGRLVPIEGRDVLAMSFYGSGVVVIDFTDVRGEGNDFPTVVAQYADHSDTWETWYYQGYLFTGDLARGMDVLSLI